MFFLKAGFPSSRHPKMVRITAANMFALCSLCGEEVHLTTQGVIRNIGNLVHGRYICPTCRMALAEATKDEDIDLDAPSHCQTCPERGTCAYYNFDEDEQEDRINVHDDAEYESNEAADNEHEERCGDEPDDAEDLDAEERCSNEGSAEAFRESLILQFPHTGL